MEIKTDELAQFHAEGIYAPARIIFLHGEIDEDAAVTFKKNILLLDFVSDKNITVLLNSDGGCVRQGLAIYDAIKECNSEVTIKVTGQAQSMAAIILQAADVRQVSTNSIIMLHEGSESYSQDHPKNIAKWVKENTRVEKICIDILLEKIKQKKPRVTRKQLTDMLVFDKILTAEQTVLLGLADSIIDHKEF